MDRESARDKLAGDYALIGPGRDSYGSVYMKLSRSWTSLMAMPRTPMSLSKMLKRAGSLSSSTQPGQLLRFGGSNGNGGAPSISPAALRLTPFGGISSTGILSLFFYDKVKQRSGAWNERAAEYIARRERRESAEVTVFAASEAVW